MDKRFSLYTGLIDILSINIIKVEFKILDQIQKYVELGFILT